MSAQVQFSMETIEGCALGKLNLPHHKVANWINFLVSPRQQAQIVSAIQLQDGLTLYFRGSDKLYAYLDGHFNCQVGVPHPETSFVGTALQSSRAVH
ncbi:MAG: hypothetical protein KME18_21455 [Phormidium tanganyikae FI6-MK23]|jgi:hypothetical protein|nr:hypothetical protein [Phormidium tanganyikae FI6-MK23]